MSTMKKCVNFFGLSPRLEDWKAFEHAVRARACLNFNEQLRKEMSAFSQEMTDEKVCISLI